MQTIKFLINFTFRIVLDLQNICKEVERVPLYFALMINISYEHGPLFT